MNKLAVVLSVAVASLAGTTIFLWQQLEKERGRNADLQARLESAASLQRPVAQSFAQRVEPSATTPPPSATSPATPEAGTTPRRAAASAGQQAQAARSAIQGLLARPEVQQAARALTPMAYPGLARELNLSAEEADKLFDLLSQQQGVGLLGSLGGDPQDLQRRLAEQRTASESEIAALLGNRYPQYQEYQRTLPQRRQVEQLQNALGADDKLTDAQTRPLVAALAAEQQRIQQDQQARMPPDPAATPQQRLQQLQQRNAENNQRLVAAATPFLTAQQLDAYRRQLERGGGGALRGLTGAGAARRDGAAGARGPANAPAQGVPAATN